jgi:hypothetical protein
VVRPRYGHGTVLKAWWRKLFGIGAPLNQNVDWEVGQTFGNFPLDPFAPNDLTDDCSRGYRIDIATDERNIFEVKRWEGPATTAEVRAQLQRYINTAYGTYGIQFRASTELSDWADFFTVYDGFWDVLPDWVYVWGISNPPGHIYFTSDEDKVNSRVRAQIARKHGSFPGEFPIPIPVQPGVPAEPGVPVESIPVP